ncbi:MAG: hypothetical protein Q9222_002779 [Ikaeria aurantiellina]
MFEKESAEFKDAIARMRQEISRDMEQNFAKWKEEIAKIREDMEELTEWFARKDKTVLRHLEADIFLAFAEKAVILLSNSDPALIAAQLRNDQSRIAVLAEFVTSIPESTYERWGLPGYQDIMRQNFLKKASTSLPRYFPYDTYEFAAIMIQPYWARSTEHRILEPLFMFVHGTTFEEM